MSGKVWAFSLSLSLSSPSFFTVCPALGKVLEFLSCSSFPTQSLGFLIRRWELIMKWTQKRGFSLLGLGYKMETKKGSGSRYRG